MFNSPVKYRFISVMSSVVYENLSVTEMCSYSSVIITITINIGGTNLLHDTTTCIYL